MQGSRAPTPHAAENPSITLIPQKLYYWQEQEDNTFYCDRTFTAHAETISIAEHFKWMLAKLELTARATGGGYKIATAVRQVPQLISCSYDLILHL